MKQNVIVFGTGSYFQRKKKSIYNKYNVVAFADNNSRLYDTIFEGKRIISPNEIINFKYDRVFIASSFFCDIANQLVKIGVNNFDIELGINLDPLLDEDEFLLRENCKAVFFVNDYGKIKCSINNINFYINTVEEYFITKEIFGEQLYNFKFPNDDKVICIDIGMNVGLATLYFAAKDNVKKVYSFEPFPETYEAALKNFKLNKPIIKDKIVANNYGLYNENKNTDVKYNYNSKGCMSVEDDNEKKFDETVDFKKVNIKLKKVSDVFEKIIKENYGCKFVCKIDCEGSEDKIIENLQNENLLKYFKVFIMEWHGKDKFDKVVNILKEDYYLYNCYQYKEITGILCAFLYNN